MTLVVLKPFVNNVNIYNTYRNARVTNGVTTIDRAGFAIRFTTYRIGGVNHSASPDTFTLRLNPSERAVLDLLVTAPPSWPTALPADLTFQVHATTPDLTAAVDLRIDLRRWGKGAV